MNDNIESKENYRDYILKFSLFLPICNVLIICVFFNKDLWFVLLAITLVVGGLVFNFIYFLRRKFSIILKIILICLNITSLIFTATLLERVNEYQLEDGIKDRIIKKTLKNLATHINFQYYNNKNLTHKELLDLIAKEEITLSHPYTKKVFSFTEIILGECDFISLIDEEYKYGNPNKVIFIERPGIRTDKTVYAVTEGGTILQGKGLTIEEILKSINTQ